MPACEADTAGAWGSWPLGQSACWHSLGFTGLHSPNPLFPTPSTATPLHLCLQDISAVEDARQACQAAGQAIPDGFVRVVQMRPARANAMHA